MYPSKHIIFGILFSGICYLLFPKIEIIGASIIFLSTVLIDVDHYIYYIYKKKDFNLKNAYNWFIKSVNKFLSLPIKQRNNVYTAFCFLHGIEILLLLLILTSFSKYFFFILIGFSFHLLLDYINEIPQKNRIDKLSLIYDHFKFKKLKNIENVKKK